MGLQRGPNANALEWDGFLMGPQRGPNVNTLGLRRG